MRIRSIRLTALSLLLAAGTSAGVAAAQTDKPDKADQKELAHELKETYEKAILNGGDACVAVDWASKDVCHDYKQALIAIDNGTPSDAATAIDTLEFDVQVALKSSGAGSQSGQSKGNEPGAQDQDGTPTAEDSEPDRDGEPTAEDTSPDEDGTPTAEDTDPDQDGTPTAEDTDPGTGDGNGGGGGSGECDPLTSQQQGLEKSDPCY